MSAAATRLAGMLLVSAWMLAACAPSPPPASKAQPAALPDWQGIWEVEGITVTAGGWITETLAEVRSTFAATLPALTP
jgi:starvation-inducible outer membrane lipoprotein